jgi:hypothetical protein
MKALSKLRALLVIINSNDDILKCYSYLNIFTTQVSHRQPVGSSNAFTHNQE